jgi:transcriptional regulator with XRE-family HTH domain
LSEPGPTPTALTVAERVAWHRHRRGLSRRALAELLGRSEEWLRLLETQGRGAERLGTLVEIARVLRLPDLGSLLGQTIVVSDSDRPRHLRVEAVRRAFAATLVGPPADGHAAVPELSRRVDQAWTAWRTSREQYTALGLLLPDLLRDADAAMRKAAGPVEHAGAHALGAQAFLLTQRFAFCVGEAELAARACDRALLAARETGDQHLIGLAAWSAAMTSLAADRPEEASDLALAAASDFLDPHEVRDAMLQGSLLLFAAIGHARARRPAEAWRCWDAAASIGQRLPKTAEHPLTMFSHANIAIYAVALAVETGDATAALDRSRHVHGEQIPSTNRRAQHYLDLARGHQRRRQLDGAAAALRSSLDASREAILFDAHARGIVTELVRDRRADHEVVTRLGRHLGVL